MIAACALGIVLGRVQTTARTAGKTDFLSSVVKTTVDPIALPIASGAQRFRDFRTGLFQSGTLIEENRRLRALAQVAALYSSRLQSLETELDEVRKLAKMSESAGKTRIPARIVHYAPLENRLTINAGSRHLVRPGLPVVAGEGLVGVVQTVDANTAQVLLLSSPPPFKIGAKVLRDPPAFGLLHGEASNRLSVEFTELNTPLDVGDWVVTSGFSEQIPANIPIGRIVQVHRDEEFGTRVAQVFPAVQIGRIRDVVVLR